MATKTANFGGPAPHTSGLFADMTVDGPEIGTLVLIVDRAKNLPNRKTMGKQNPYCAGRLGKEARKTETDKRGGQTPKWDQELRFTVHDSPDYHKLKISVFSEDKRTDLVGEAWVNLTDILVPGGGKSDLWQGLNYKGKYAGELRLELTYYDSRPKPEPVPESVVGTEELRQSVGSGSGRVKRRPLPSNPNSGHVTPETISGPAAPVRARHGPRDFRTPPRANSMPPESMMYSQQHAPHDTHNPDHIYNSSPGGAMQHYTPPNQYYGEYDPYQESLYGDGLHDHADEADFLPQLPPSNRQRERQAPMQRFGLPQAQQPTRPQSMVLPHSQSAPIVPQTTHIPDHYDDQYHMRLDYPEPIPDVDYQHHHLSHKPRGSDVSPGSWGEYNDIYADQLPMAQEDPAPPPPPMHSNSAPVVPHYSSPQAPPMSSSPLAAVQPPPHVRHHSVPNTSPLQSIERSYVTPQRVPVPGQPSRGSSVDGYPSSPEISSYKSSPLNLHGPTPSPYSRPQPSRPLPHRNSIADPYQYTPPRPHPLSQEVPRPRSPLPPHRQSSPQPMAHSAGPSPYQHDYRGMDVAPLIKPRAISPQPSRPPSQSNSAPRPHSSYSIQHPVRAFESSDNSPLSTSRPPVSLQTSQRPTSARKSISSPNTPSSATGGVPFSPDSFNIHNPNAQRVTIPEGNSPHSPYQVQPGTAASPKDRPNGPIVGWHGQEIDPSDHLPVDSWAPEPEKKVPVKAYGLGRDRDFGPRSAQSTPPGSGSRNLSKDTVVNFRIKSQPQPQPEPESPSRNRLQKKNKSPIVEPLRERHNFNSVSVPNPYEQQEYSRGFYATNDHGYSGGSVYGASFSSSPNDALAREISNIDIGSGRNSRAGSVPSPVAYVPVRSHKDRTTYY